MFTRRVQGVDEHRRISTGSAIVGVMGGSYFDEDPTLLDGSGDHTPYRP